MLLYNVKYQCYANVTFWCASPPSITWHVSAAGGARRGALRVPAPADDRQTCAGSLLCSVVSNTISVLQIYRYYEHALTTIYIFIYSILINN